MTVSSTTTKNSYSGDGSTTVFAYTFKIFAQADVTVILRASDGTETVQTISTDYTVSGVGNSGGGNITFTTAPTSTQTVVLLRNTSQTQNTDYTPNDPFPAASHEDALDKLTFITQELEEELGRAIKISRTNTMTSTEFSVGSSDRANKFLSFDGNGELVVSQEIGTFRGDWSASTDYQARDIVKDTSTNNIFLANTAHTSSGAEPLTTNTDSAKWDLLVDAASATTSATNAATSATNAATSATNAATSATSAETAKTAAETAQTSAETAQTAAESAQSAAETAQAAAETALDTFDDKFLGSKSTDPTVDNDGDALTDGALYFNTTDDVMKVYDLGNTQWKQLTPTTSQQANIDTVSTNIADVNTVAADETDIGTVAGISTDIGTVAGISSDVTAVSGKATEVGRLGTADAVADMNTLGTADAVSDMNTLAAISANITTVAGNDANVTTVAGVSSDVTTVAGISANVTTVAGISANVTTVAGDSADIQAVAGDTTNIGTVATNIANVNSVGGSIANVNTVATNISDVNSFADTYFISATEPSSPTVGDLWFDTTNDVMKVYSSGGFINAGSAVNGTANRETYTVGTSEGSYTGSTTVFPIEYDAGYIDVYLNGIKLDPDNDFTATNGTSVTLSSAAATGDIVDMVGYGTFELADFSVGAANNVDLTDLADDQILRYNSTSGNFEAEDLPTGIPDQSTHSGKFLTTDGSSASWATVTQATGNELENLSEDSTPQLGGALDVNGNNITSASNGDVTIDPNGTGDIILDANVGVGTSSPSNPSGTSITVYDSTTPRINLKNSTTGDTSTAGGEIRQSGNQMSVTNRQNSDLIFGTNNTERMRINSSGSVGIGTTSPATAFHVSKTATSSQRIRVQNGEGSADYGTDANRALIYVGGNQKFRIDSGGLAYLNSEGGSVAYVNVQQGAAKSWGNIDGTGTTHIDDSYNMSSVTDAGTGQYDFFINNDMNNAHFTTSLSSEIGGGNGGFNGLNDSSSLYTAARYRFIAYTDSGSRRDVDPAFGVVHGDQA